MIARAEPHRRRVLPPAVLVVALVALVLTGCRGDEDQAESDADRQRASGTHQVAERDVADDAATTAEQAPEVPAEDSAPSTAPPAAASVAQRSEELARVGEQALAGSSLEIPSIGVSTPLLSLGLNGDRSMEVPADFSRAGWYRYSPVPGDVGPSVIAGHVDSRSGPAIFYRLTDLTAGDRVTVNYADGRVAEFAVTAIEQHPKDAFPHQRVYGETAGPELRLITCGGVFDSARGAHRDNVIVYATLVG